jgi:hypothetical protein
MVRITAFYVEVPQGVDCQEFAPSTKIFVDNYEALRIESDHEVQAAIFTETN